LTRRTEHAVLHQKAGLRSLRQEDAEALGELLYEAYLGTVDYEGETSEEAFEEAVGTLAGKYGPVDFDASFVIEADDRLLSATVVTAFAPLDAPLLAFAMTRPEAQRRGLARDLIRRTLSSLAESGHGQVGLFVSPENAPALRLYEGLGFCDGRESTA